MNLQPVKALKRQNLGLFEGGYKYQQPSPTTKKSKFLLLFIIYLEARVVANISVKIIRKEYPFKCIFLFLKTQGPFEP